LFERPEAGERAILVHITLASETEPEDPEEFRELVESAGVTCVGLVTGTRHQPSSRLFLGSGKLESLRELMQAEQADVVLFNHVLSPSQERNLEGELRCRVLDRTGVILDIFAQRARTHEGKLQVELAQLEHMSTRLIRGWTHLERQKGGIGGRGPGETQLETDRRLLRGRIKQINRRLEKVRKQREQGRRARRKADIPTASLVGYTNAGKSSLFNLMTESTVYEADQLFATLDPTVRRISVPDVGPVVLADTVGFIRHLPHTLVEAFRATLEETVEASILLHVIDNTDPERDDTIHQVESVLADIGADDIPVLQVCNKIDRMQDASPRLERDEQGRPVRVWLSAMTGEGLELLYDAMAERLAEDVVHHYVKLSPAEGWLRARFYQTGAVVAERWLDGGEPALEIRMQERDWCQLLGHAAVSEDRLSFLGNQEWMSAQAKA